MSEETSSVILDGTNPTLDASQLSYEFEKARFTGNITRITTKQDPLNNISDLVSGVYVGKEYVIPDSGGHMMKDLRAVAGDIKYTIAMDSMKRNMDQGLKRVQSKKDRFKVNEPWFYPAWRTRRFC